MLRQIIALLAGLLVGLSVFVWAESFSSSFDACKNREASQEGRDGTKKYESGVRVELATVVRCTGRFVNDHNGGITAFATLIIALFTGTIWGISQSQLTHSHRVERAYVSCSGSLQTQNERTWQGRLREGQIVDISVPTGNFQTNVSNNGKTPAELLEIAVEFCEADEIPPQPVYNRRPCHDWIGPGILDCIIDVVMIPPKITNPVVYGRLYYRDIFSAKIHSSGFIQDREGLRSRTLRAPSSAYTDWD